MRRIVAILGFLYLLHAGFAYAQRLSYNGICESGNVSVNIDGTQGSTKQKFQQSFPSCTVTVYRTGTLTLATIYSDARGTSLSNPFTAQSSGRFQFFVDPGTYDIKLSDGGIPAPFTISSVSIGITASIPNCSSFPGSDSSIKITNCIGSIPATGGKADAQQIFGSQTWSQCPFVGVTKPVTLILGAGTTSINVNCNIPSNIRLDSTAGAILAPALGNTLTINGTISAGMTQIFGGAGTVLLSPTNIPEVYPQWFGVTYSGSDESAALQAAINSFGSVGTFRGGRLRITGTIGIANTITIWNKNIEIAGCGWADFAHMTQPCGVKWVATSDSTTKDMFKLISNAGLWMHDLHFEGNNGWPVQSVLGFTTDPGQNGAQQFDHFERITIGPYPGGLNAGFKYGVYVYGANSNNDSMEWDNLVVAGASDSDIYIANSQSQIWQLHNIGIFGAGVAGIKTAGSLDLIGGSFASNATDFVLVKDRQSNTSLVRLFIDDLASEGSARFMNFEGSGANSVMPEIVLMNSRFGFGNGNTPPDDGACGPGTGTYAHCTRIWDGRNTSFTLRIMNFCIDGGGSAGSQFPIIDFSNSGSAWSVNAEMDWSVDCGDQSSNFLLGSANNGTDNIEHFHYRYMGNTGSSHPAEWNYEAGAAFGNAPYFIPQPGVIMRRSMLNGTGGSQTCSGTCILDLTRGMVQVFQITGNVTSWTVPNINSFPRTGLDRVSIWMCARGGNYTASAPLMASSNPIKNWGFTATINDGTCAHQDIEFNGFGGSVASPLTTSYYGVRFENGITP